MSASTVEHPKVVSRNEWIAARKELLAKEKALTRQRDALAQERLQFPWLKVEKNYVFDTPAGKKSLADLFGGKNQLAIYHFMLGVGLGGGVPELFAGYGSDGSDGDSPGSARRAARACVACAAREDRGVQEADGMEVAVGFVVWKRLQF